MSHDSDKETGRDFLIYITIIKQMCQNITSCSCTFPVGVNIVVRVCLLNHARLFATLDCSPAGSSVYGIAQARILEWVAISSSRGSSQPRDQTASLASPALAGRFFTTSAILEACEYSQPMGSTLVNSTSHGSKLLGKKFFNFQKSKT